MDTAPSGSGPVDPYGNWQKYTRARGPQRLLIGRFLATVRGIVEQAGVSSIIDAGCAEGFVAAFLQDALPDLTCTGCDIDAQALRRGAKIHPAFPSQQADILHLPYRSRSADLVLCLEVLEHLEAPAEALAELRRVTRRYCLLSVPHEPLFRLTNLARGKSLSRWGDDPEHRQHWTRAGFVRLLQQANLEVRVLRSPFPWLVALAEARG